MTTWIVDNGGGQIVVADLGDIPDGGGYYKSPVLWESGDKTKLDGIDTGAKDDQTGDEIVTAINASAGGINLDKAASGTTNKLLTANEKTGAGNAYAWLTGTGIQEDVPIKAATLNLSQIAVIADDAFQKSADDLDDIDDGTSYQRVNAASVDASGNVNKVYDGSSLRAIGTAENEIALLGAGGKFATSQIPATTVVINGSGKLAQADASVVDLNDIADGSTHVRVPIAETKEVVIWADEVGLEKRVAGAVTGAPNVFVETAQTVVTKKLIPYYKNPEDQTIILRGIIKNSSATKDSVVALDIVTIAVDGSPSPVSVVTLGTAQQTGTSYQTVSVSVNVTGLADSTAYWILVQLYAETGTTTATLANAVVSRVIKVVV